LALPDGKREAHLHQVADDIAGHIAQFQINYGSNYPHLLPATQNQAAPQAPA